MCKMVTTESLVEEFRFIGVNVSDDIINKCLDICIEHNIDTETFVEQWVAFGVSNLNGQLEPTVNTLEIMVRKQFTEQETAKTNTNMKKPPTNIKVYTSGEPDMNDIMSAYITGTPKSNRKGKRERSPGEIKQTNKPSFTPMSYSPAACKPSTIYSERLDSKKSLMVFGSRTLTERNENVRKAQVSIDDWPIADNKYMCEAVKAKGITASNVIDRLGLQLITKFGLDEPSEGFIQYGSGVITTYGRIRCDDNGRLNSSSVLLEASLKFANGQNALVNFSKLTKYSLFPGQVVAMRATGQTSGSRDTIFPESLYTDGTLDLPADLPDIQSTDPLDIVVACGPYTLADNLTYQPLQDLVNYVVTRKPHVLLLTGPFIDFSHESIVNGSLAETYQSHFESLIDSIMRLLHDTNVQVVLVPSYKDAHHHNVYPTPPYELHKRYSNLHLATDPCIINVEGLLIGATTPDVLFHMAQVELNYPASNPDRIGRFVSHILAQQCFYPIYPPVEGLPLDFSLLDKHARLSVTPHIMVLPSNLRYFVKNINGCIVINPERLSKCTVGGSLCCMQIYPNQTIPSVADNFVCQIMKI